MPGEDYQSWSTTAASNDTADTAINWREGMARAAVNDSSRSLMAAHAKHRNLTNGSIVTTGLPDAQNFTSGVGYITAVPPNMRVMLKIGTGLTNTGPVTLNMDGIGDVAVKSQTGEDLNGGELIAASFVEFVYNGTNWIMTTAQTTGAQVVILPPVEAAGSSQIIFTNLDDSYDEYIVVLTNVVAETNGAALWVQVTFDNGATWEDGEEPLPGTFTGPYKWALDVIYNGSNTWGGVQDSTSPAIKLTTGFISNDPTSPLGGEVRVYTPSLTAIVPIDWRVNHRDTSPGPGPYIQQWRGVGAWFGTPAPVTGIRFLMSSGNIATGKFGLMGIKK